MIRFQPLTPLGWLKSPPSLIPFYIGVMVITPFITSRGPPSGGFTGFKMFTPKIGVSWSNLTVRICFEGLGQPPTSNVDSFCQTSTTYSCYLLRSNDFARSPSYTMKITAVERPNLFALCVLMILLPLPWLIFSERSRRFLTRVGLYYSYKWNYNPKKAGVFHPSWAPVIFGPFTNGYTVTLPCRTVTMNGVSFLVPLIGGSMVVAYNHPIGKDYKWLYVRGIYCQTGDYMLPTMLPPIKGRIETAFETTHTIHGTGIFTYMKTSNHKNQPFM